MLMYYSCFLGRELKGVFFWTMDLDDFSGKFCLSGKFPLISAAKFILTDAEPLEYRNTNKTRYVRVCYFTSWAQWRKPIARFTPHHIPPNLCTHIVYAFARLENGLVKQMQTNDQKIYKQLQNLKKKNKNLKIILAVGGWNNEKDDSSPFSVMVQTSGSRKIFIDDVIKYLRTRDFDGLDLHWNYPTLRGNSPPSDRHKFTILCKELKEAFDKEALNTWKTRMSLTAAVAAEESTVNAAYEISELGRYLDAIHLMTYDLHGSWETKTGHHTTMQANDPNSVIRGVEMWIKGGFPADKIVLGLATYGRSFKIQNVQDHGLGAAVTSGGEKGQFTEEFGFMAYYEICHKVRRGMKVSKKNKAFSPYGYQGNFWVGFDDASSVRYKVKTLVKG